MGNRGCSVHRGTCAHPTLPLPLPPTPPHPAPAPRLPTLPLPLPLLPGCAQALLRELVKEVEVGLTSATPYEEWKAALEEKAGDRAAKVEDAFM